MPKSLAKTPVTLLIDDQGAGLYLESGQFLGLMPAADPVLGLRAAWIPALRELVAAGTEVQLLLDQSGLLVQCQEAPSLNAREIRDVAIRVFAAETGAEDLECAGAQDADPLAGGGQVLWLAAQPRGEMHEWIGAIQGAGLVPAWAMPFQRALLQGLDSLWDTGPVRLVLAVTPSRVGHLCFFQGRSLALQRSFAFPADGTEAEELAYEEVSRLLQFIKQKNRELSFHSLEVLGLPPFSAGFQARVRSALGMEVRMLAPVLWPVLVEGLGKERGRKDGLNLVPLEIQEAGRLRLFKGAVWAASAALALVFLTGTLFLCSQELILQGEVDRSSQLLALRESRTTEEARTVDARVPLLRVKLAEQRQGQAVTGLSRLGTWIFQPPQGIQLEKVEILQLPGDRVTEGFTITGLAFTERGFSVGPLAQYVLDLNRQAGLTLEPVAEATISDRVVAGQERHLDQLAITRFTLKGTFR